MNKLRTFSCLGCATAVGLLAVFAPTHAAEVKITWEEPETYSDVKPTNESRKRFRERTLEDLEQHIVELASDLPESQVLSVAAVLENETLSLVRTVSNKKLFDVVLLTLNHKRSGLNPILKLCVFVLPGGALPI